MLLLDGKGNITASDLLRVMAEVEEEFDKEEVCLFFSTPSFMFFVLPPTPLFTFVFYCWLMHILLLLGFRNVCCS